VKEFRNTKFWHAAFVQATGTVALFMRVIDGGTYVALSTLALSVYVAGNIAADKMATERLKVEMRSE
jgi:hypothetical protein